MANTQVGQVGVDVSVVDMGGVRCMAEKVVIFKVEVGDSSILGI